MTTTQWVATAIVALIGGGAMGAVITAFVSRYRSRRQPVAYTIETIEIFKRNPEFQSLKALLMFGDEETGSGPARSVSNLSVARVTISNKGNQDIERFEFGATLGGTDEAIEVRLETPDRHHRVELLKAVDLQHPGQELDFSVQPFNRDDKYHVSIIFSYIDSPRTIELTSAHTTRFIETASGKIGIEAFIATHSHTMLAILLTLLAAMVVSLFSISIHFFEMDIKNELPPIQSSPNRNVSR